MTVPTSQDEAPATPTVASTPESRQHRLVRLLILRARLKGLSTLIEKERQSLEADMKQAGDVKLRSDEGESFFRTTRKPRVTDPQRLLEVVPAHVLAEMFKPTVAFVEGMTKAGKDWKSCIAIDEPEEFRVENARTAAAKEYYKQIAEETAQKAAQLADHIAGRIMSPATNPPTT